MTTEVLEAARSGNGDAFGALTEQHRRELHVHCYRMLGSVDDADDLVQETMLAAWRGLPDFDGRSSLRTWLYRIATNRCLSAIRAGSRRPPTAPVPPFEPPAPNGAYDVPWLQPYPDRLLDPAQQQDARTTIGLAFVAALQRLPPRQTATLLLVDVLGFDPIEAAGILGVGRTALKGLLQRARAALGVEPPPVDADDRISALASRFADAFAADDVNGVIALLTDDAWLAMPPAPHQYAGPEAIAGFLRASAAGRGGTLGMLPTAANAQPAFGCYVAGPGADHAIGSGIVVITVDASAQRVRAITRFLDPRLLGRFGLPERL